MSSLFGNLGGSQANKPSLFGTTATTSQPAPSLFSSLNTPQPTNPTGGLFGSSTATTTTTAPATSSLFGATATTPAAGGLFGASTASQAPATSSLFGGTATNPAPASGSLFGATATQPAATTSLFGTTATQAPAASSLFGGTTPQAPATTSLFGQPTAQQQPQPQSSLFGATATQPQLSLAGQLGNDASKSQGGLQGLAAIQSQSGGASNAYFDSLLEKSRKRAHGDAALEEIPSLQLGLGDLRQRIKRLGPATAEQAVDGRAHYLLAASGVDPGAALRDLGYLEVQVPKASKDTTFAPAADTDVTGYLAGLQSQTTLSMIADGLSRAVRDFDSFLDDNVNMEWEAQRKRIYEHFGIKPREPGPGSASFAASTASSQGGFGKSRRSKVSVSVGPKSVANGSAFGRSNLQRSIIGTSGPVGSVQASFSDVEKKADGSGLAFGAIPEDRALKEKEGRYCGKVQSLNLSRLNNSCFPVLKEFCEVESLAGDQHGPSVVNAYRAVIEMVGEDPAARAPTDPKAVKARQYSEVYLDETESSARSIKMKKQILAGTNRFLEKQFFQDLEALIAKNPREASLGGVPTVMSKIRAYIRLRSARKDLVPDNTDLQMLGDDHVWALIFYLLRSGHIREAAEFVTSNAVAFRAIDRNFITYITDYYNNPDRRLRRELQDRINNEYNQRVRIAPEHSIDPFKMACYKVIGRCDLSKRNLDGLNQSMDDWVWLQFNLAREVSKVDEIAGEVYGLAEVQNTVLEIGARHFAKGADQNGGFGVYFYLQVLAGLFERAVAYLYPFNYVDAVHFGIALSYYGLLRVSNPTSSEDNLLNFSTRDKAQINFGRMVGYYTRDFRAASAAAAVDYLVLICLNGDLPGTAGQEQTSLCHEALRELVLESRDFTELLGDVRLNGDRVGGVIEERLALIGLEDTNDFMRTVILQAASIADDNGRTTDAVLLYHLAGEYDTVITVICRALSDALAVDIGQEPLRLQPLKPRSAPTADGKVSSSVSLISVDDPIVLAKNILGFYNPNPVYFNNIRSQNRNACGILINMCEAKTRVAEQRWAEAIDIIIELDLLPLRAGGDGNMIRQYATKFASLPQAIMRNVPSLMLWTIVSCERQRSILASSTFSGNEGTRRIMRDDLRQKARDLMMYAGFLKYRLPAHVNDALARAAAD